MRVAVTIGASRAAVWERLSDLRGHVDWMADADEIRFTSRSRSGVGTAFDCDTRVGPLRLTDRMRVVEWRPRRAIGVHHEGVVSGTGRFTLHRLGRRRTRLIWTEWLSFPWWMGGRAGRVLATPVLRAVWRGNLRRFRDMFDGV